MRPTEVGNRISLANEALLNVGSRIVLGYTPDIESVEYLEADGKIYEFRPLERFGSSDAD